MAEPDWFAARMIGLAAVPEPLWWLLGAIVGFYFGARHQVKGQEWHARLAAGLAASAALTAAPAAEEDNAALADWRRGDAG